MYAAAFLSLSAFSAPSFAAEADHTDAWRQHLAAERAVQIERLRSYASAGVFPVNDDQPGLLNIFMDEQGRRCGMAELIWQSGESALVWQTAQAHNDVRLGDVTDGPLVEWILTHGLTQEEVAFVQEPDFFISNELPIDDQQLMLAAEQQRLRAHFMTAAAQLDAYNDDSLEIAVSRLGERVHSPPPSTAVATNWGWLR